MDITALWEDFKGDWKEDACVMVESGGGEA